MVRGSNRFYALVLIVCIVAVSLSGCGGGQTQDEFEENNEIFFRSILNHIEPDDVVIHSLDAYRVDNWYYYHVTYSYVSPVTHEWTDLNQVYFGSHRIKNYFSLTWEDWGDMEQYRDAYYAAVEKGEHVTFSQEEIQEHMDAFYASR